MKMSLYSPLVKLKVGVFYHACPHNQSPGFSSCNPEEIATKLRELKTKAVIIVGKYDEEHLKIYREAVLRSGLNPLLVRIVDSSWGETAIEGNKAILENAWTAELAMVEEKTLPASRREVLLGKLPKVKDRVDKPVYIKDMCQGLYRACTLCEESCPYNALKVDKKSGIIIDYDKCTGCGLCVSSCPLSAIQFPSVSQSAVFELSKIKGDKTISCYKDNNNSIKLPCILMLSAEDIVLLRSNGKLNLVCPGCELSKNLSKIKDTVTEINNKIGGISFVYPEGKVEAKEPKSISIQFNYLGNRNEARREILKHEKDLPLYYEVSINENSCTLCESCAKWCPTSAITLKRGEGEEFFEFDPEKCIGCKICVNVCPEGSGGNSCSGPKAIKVEKAERPSKKVLVQDYLVRCRVCGAPVGSRKSLNLVKKIMKERGAECDDEWLERCPKHRAEYAFQQRFGMTARFRPRKFGENG